MSTDTIGVGGTHTSIEAWANKVKALGDLSSDETGVLIDAVAYTRANSSDLNFGSVVRNGFIIKLMADPSVRNDGNFGNGARVEFSSTLNFDPLYDCRNITIEGVSFDQTATTGNGKDCLAANNTQLFGVLARTSSSTYAVDVAGGGVTLSAVHAVAATGSAFRIQLDRANLLQCSALSGATGF